YQQEGFHSGTCSDSSRSPAETWLVEENGIFETQSVELISHSPPLTKILQPFSPTIFLVSDIKAAELISDNDLPSPAIKRLNPEQQSYLNNSGIGSSSTPDLSRTITNEELNEWINVLQPSKKFNPDNVEMQMLSPSIISIIGTLHFYASIGGLSQTRPTTTAASL
ncbi:hypothetical protein MKX03_020415, partial [Papaver bracteatum]